MEYNLKITTDDSELQDTQDLLVEIGDTANELQDDIDDAFTAEPVEIFAAATEDAAAALSAEAAAASRAATSQTQLNNATSKGTKANKRLGSSLVTNALRMAGFSKEARIAGAGLNILNKVSLKGIGSGIKNLAIGTKNLLVGGVKSLVTGFIGLASTGANAFKTLALSANSASKIIKLALVSTGVGALVVGVGLLIANFDSVKSAVSSLGGTFSVVFGKVKEVITTTIELTRDLLSTITGGLVDSAERAAERSAQVAREAAREAVTIEIERQKRTTALIESETALKIKKAKEVGATQQELDKISIEGNKQKAKFLQEELKQQEKLANALFLEVQLQREAKNQDKDSSEALLKAQAEELKAQKEINKTKEKISQTAIDNAKIIEDAAAREEAAIKKANDERRETLRLEGLRKEDLEKLRDELLRSEEEVQIRRAQIERDATQKRIDESIATNEEKNRLTLANDQAFLEEKANIESTFAQARLDLENSITLNATDLKIQKINEETQARIEAIQKTFGETEKADELILALQKQQADKIQDIQRKARDKEEKAQAKIIKDAIDTAKKKIELSEAIAINEVNASIEAGETKEEFAIRSENEIAKIKIQSAIDTNNAILDINKNLTDDEIALLKERNKALANEYENLGGEIEKKDNPFDFKKKIKDALNDIGLDDQEAESAIQAAQQFAGQIIGQFEAAADARLQAAEEVLDFRNENIERLNQELANEIEINKLGLASNIERVQEEIAQEKQLRDEALAEQEAAARKKEQIETAQQAASLLTAIAQLYSSLSGLPFGIGIGIATGLSAVLLSQFVASKTKVASITKKRKGGLVDGPSHEHGGVKYYSEDSSNVVELEGNEFVTPVKQTKKHFKFLEAMRHGKFDDVNLMDAIYNPSHISGMNDAVVYYNMARDSSNNQNVVDAINKAAILNNRGLQDLQDKPSELVVGENIVSTVFKNGNKIRTITKIK